VAGQCEICGKHKAFGRNIRYKARGSSWLRKAPKTSRTFEPNIQVATLMIDGVRRRMKVCTRCLRTQTKSS
jgi:large subunit ribosomal protein L28